MKTKIVVAALLSMSSIGVATAAPNNVGCGLGVLVFEGHSGLAPQVLAVTTNGTFGSQTFGITSGTSGCAEDGVVQEPVQVSMFLDNNLDKVAHDMAVGQGETLDSLASLIGLDASQKGSFFALVKNNFPEIISSEHATTKDVVEALNRVMAKDKELAKYAHLV
jgi:hypothetical protein